MRFLCDEMLKGLARWLRIAGYDVALEPDATSDRLLIERALAEGRVLLSRDRSLLTIRNAARVVVLLDSNGLDNWVQELAGKLAIDWLHDPFTRCSLCNTSLVKAERAPGLHANVAQAYYCTGCAKYYWCGGHVQRMRTKLARWQALAAQQCAARAACGASSPRRDA